ARQQDGGRQEGPEATWATGKETGVRTEVRAVRGPGRQGHTHSTFFLQSTHGSTGNFELMALRLAGGGADHFWRNNDDAALPWIASGLAFGSPDDVYALSVIQGPLGAVGNLEVVALEGSQLVHHWRDDGDTWKWQARTLLPGSVPNTYSVALIQSSHGTLGNYEVVAPVAASGGGGLAHWWRDNDTTGYPWNGPM